jgi:hypothetical protein
MFTISDEFGHELSFRKRTLCSRPFLLSAFVWGGKKYPSSKVKMKSALRGIRGRTVADAMFEEVEKVSIPELEDEESSAVAL